MEIKTGTGAVALAGNGHGGRMFYGYARTSMLCRIP